jgi:lambda family phage portal protein
MIDVQTAIDRVVAALAPGRALKRARDRMALEQVGTLRAQLGRYDGGSLGGRLKDWAPTGGGPNTERQSAMPTLRNRSWDLYRNNAHAARAVTVYADNVVGAGIVPSFRGTGTRRVERVERLAEAHLLSTAIDVHGKHDLHGMMWLAVLTMIVAGEVLIRILPRSSASGLAVPLQLELLEPDWLDDAKNEEFRDGGRIVNGVELASDGRPLAYWLHRQAPHDLWLSGGLPGQSVRVPAQQIIHLFDVTRPGLLRGIPWLAPVMVRLAELQQFEEAKLVAQKIAACYSVFEVIPEAEPTISSETKEPVVLEPGVRQFLPPGHDVRFSVPPPTDGYRDYVTAQQHAIAAGMSIPFALLSGDLSQVNFSSGRMGWLDFARRIDVIRWKIVIPRAAVTIGRAFLGACEQLVSTTGIEIDWTPPSREMFSPREEMTALETKIGLGIMSRSQAIREQGGDPRKMFAEIGEERVLMSSLGAEPPTATSNGPRRDQVQEVTP